MNDKICNSKKMPRIWTLEKGKKWMRRRPPLSIQSIISSFILISCRRKRAVSPKMCARIMLCQRTSFLWAGSRIMKGQTIKRKDSNVPGLLLEFEGYDRGWPSCCASLTAGAGTRCMSLLSSSPNLLTKSKDSCSYLLSFCYGSRLKESSVNLFIHGIFCHLLDQE